MSTPPLPFEESAATLQDPRSESAAKLALRAMGAGPSPTTRAGRVLLSAFLVAVHHAHVLDGREKDEVNALCAARRMVLCVHAGTLPALAHSWRCWRQAYFSWKKADMARMTDSITRDAVASEALRDAVHHRSTYSSVSTRSVSPASSLPSSLESCASAYEPSSSAVSPASPVPDASPTVCTIPHLSSPSTIHASLTPIHASLTPIPAAYGLILDNRGYVAAEAVMWEEKINAKQEQLRTAMGQLAGEHGVSRLEAAVAQTRQIPDERLAHELMVDPDAVLSNMKPLPVPNENWQRLRAELSCNEPGGVQTSELFNRVSRIEQDLNAMTSESFAPVDRSVAASEFCPSYAVEFVESAAAALQKSQAEASDASLCVWLDGAVRRLRSPNSTYVDSVVAVLRELTQRISDVRETVITARMHLLAPIVRQHGPAWERSRFGSRVVSGEIDAALPKTRRFLQCDAVTIPGHARHLLRTAIVTACASTVPITVDLVPEILWLDVPRLVALQNDIQRATLHGSLDVITRQFLSTLSAGAAAAYNYEHIRAALLDDSSRQIDIQNALVVAVRHAGLSPSPKDEMLLRGMIERVVKSDSPIFQLIFSRLVSRVRSLLQTCVSPPTAGPSQQQQAGLAAVESDISSVVRRIEALAVHTFDVHGEQIAHFAADPPPVVRGSRDAMEPQG
jgi:T-complex protein 11